MENEQSEHAEQSEPTAAEREDVQPPAAPPKRKRRQLKKRRRRRTKAEMAEARQERALPGKPGISETARRAARRDKTGKLRQGSNNRGKLANEERIEMVVRLLRSFEEPPYVARVVAKAFKCDEGTVRDDIARVRAEDESRSRITAEDERETYRMNLLEQVKQCYREGDKAEARKHMDLVLRIGGHYAPDQLKILAADLAKLPDLSDDDLAKQIAELERQGSRPSARELELQAENERLRAELAKNGIPTEHVAAVVSTENPAPTGEEARDHGRDEAGASGAEPAHDDPGADG